MSSLSQWGDSPVTTLGLLPVPHAAFISVEAFQRSIQACWFLTTGKTAFTIRLLCRHLLLPMSKLEIPLQLWFVDCYAPSIPTTWGLGLPTLSLTFLVDFWGINPFPIVSSLNFCLPNWTACWQRCFCPIQSAGSHFLKAAVDPQKGSQS